MHAAPARWTQAPPSHSHVSFLSPERAVPPNNTVRALAVSNAMAMLVRPDGSGVAFCDHAVPLYAHVSPWNTRLSSPPPKSTVRSRAESYAMALLVRAAGPAAPVAHVVPFHVQVSPLIAVS